MAVYGSQIEAGKSEQEALDAVATVLEKTSVLDDSARDSLQTFASGKGDVLIGYENEAIQAKDEGIELEYVVPDVDDQDREPRRRHDRRPRTPRPRRRSSTSSSRMRGSRSSPTTATAR